MEEDQDFSLYGKAVIAEANLRDETLTKLLADFFGSQTGEALDLQEQPCTNRLLIQVGLMKEENNLPWVAVVEWLEKIFPDNQSADFRCLIERGIATTLSLGRSSRQAFLESNVNFNFVGPICDSIGVERTTLLEMKDFSEQAKLIEVTNGLILELSKFVTREKIDPVLMVTWLRNFNPEFCKNGDIQKASKILKSKIKKFKMLYRNYETRSHRRNLAMENLLQTPFELVTKKAERKKKPMRRDTLLEYEMVKVKEEEESVSIMQDVAQTFPRHHPSQEIIIKKERVILDEDCNQETRSFNESRETPDNKGEALALLDVAMLSVQKLMSVYGGKTTVSRRVSMDLLRNHFALTCKEHQAMMDFDAKIESLTAKHSLASPLLFLHYNAHFLVDIHNAIEQQVMSVEREIIVSTSEKLGRDENPKFHRIVNFSESATSRYIHMACDILSPRTPGKQNYRRHWVAFCEEKKNPSRLAVNVSNRLINYFEAAAGLVHHYNEIGPFFSDLLLLSNDDFPNVVLESVAADAADDVIQSLVCVLAIVYCKVLGPYWQLLKSRGEYSLFSHYVLCLYQKLLEWSENPAPLLQPEGIVNVFLQFPLQEKTFDRVFSFCNHPDTNWDFIKTNLQKMVKVIAAITEENFRDFLPGGIYSQSPPSDVCAKLANCTFSVLMGEYPFGHAYPYKKKRPDKFLQYLPNPSTSGSSLEDSEESDMSEDASGKSPRRPPKTSPTGRKAEQPPQAKRHRGDKKDRLDKSEKLGGSIRKYLPQIEPPPEPMSRETVIATVTKNGGPCKTQPDVDKLMVRFDGRSRAEKREALRCEILFQKLVLGNTDPHLDDVPYRHSEMVTKLKLALPRVKPGFSLVLAPRLTKPKIISKQTPYDQTGQDGCPNN